MIQLLLKHSEIISNDDKRIIVKHKNGKYIIIHHADKRLFYCEMTMNNQVLCVDNTKPSSTFIVENTAELKLFLCSLIMTDDEFIAFYKETMLVE